MKEFKLPEKWCIWRTEENAEVLNEWNNKHPLFKEQDRDRASWIKEGNYFYSDKKHEASLYQGYTEITFEQFKSHVLEEEFKVGDWVYTTSNLATEDFPAQVVQIDEIIEQNSRFVVRAYFEHMDGRMVILNTRWFNSLKTKDNTKIRKATQDEINMITKKEFTIKDLAEGRCAVHNDGTLDELRLVLKTAFPNDTSGCKGTYNFYLASLKGHWVGATTTDNKIQSVKTFIKNMSKTKEIIGYKLIKQEYEDAVFAITGISRNWDGLKQNWFLKNHQLCLDYSKYVAKLEVAGVLNLWFEPICKEEVKIFKMDSESGQFEIEVSEKGIYYRPESKYLNAAILSDILKTIDSKCTLTTSIHSSEYPEAMGYPVKVQKIDIGCKKSTLVSQWNDVLQYYKDVKGA